ncbi:unnamed protein product [Rhodiola kirilowii]
MRKRELERMRPLKKKVRFLKVLEKKLSPEKQRLRCLERKRVKLGDVMGILNKKAIEASDALRPIPDLRTGDIIEIKLEVPENRRRLSIYKGIVIFRQNAGIHTTIRMRRIIAGVRVEIVFPIYSPNIKEIKLVKHRKVRRARLYYLQTPTTLDLQVICIPTQRL